MAKDKIEKLSKCLKCNAILETNTHFSEWIPKTYTGVQCPNCCTFIPINQFEQIVKGILQLREQGLSTDDIRAMGEKMEHPNLGD